MPFDTTYENQDTIFLIGRLELAKREKGFTEEMMYTLQLLLKDPKERAKLAKKWNCSLLEAEKFYTELKYRRKLYRDLRRQSKENKQKKEVSQIIKEKDE